MSYRPFARLLACLFVCLLAHLATAQTESVAERGRLSNFFESEIRPALVEHCLDCHATDSEASGGLLLDSRLGWEAGGDSGKAIEPGQPDNSRLLRAITYEDPELQMPPDGKLPPAVVQSFRQWIAEGAFDPRDAGVPLPRPQLGLPVESAQTHWAYRPLQPAPIPEQAAPTSSPIDFFIQQRLTQAGLPAAPAANSDVLIRRLYFDLIGLPPPSQPASAFSEAEYVALVDKLLRSPQFGEHFARKWMDVARYAESITLRGFVLPEAWRYRDYLIAAYAEDRPFDQMIQEQVAGDLLSHNQTSERQRQLIATGFLAMGNTNLEQQDKTQLEMDYIDEQLELIGRAFLGQTIGCARCHDHKFDPIPTRDYYALAGIMRSAVALEHENVSKWIEQPLPLPAAEQARYEQLKLQSQAVNQQLAKLKKIANRESAKDQRMIAVDELAGVVVDSSQAKLVGQWVLSSFVGRVIGDGYVHDDNRDKGQKTATFEPNQLPAGEYEVRLAYTASANRATNAMVRVFSADGEKTLYINQQRPPTEEGLWLSLGEFRFEKDGQAFVLVSNEQSDGHVIVDAVQFLPRGQTLASTVPTPTAETASPATSIDPTQLAKLEAEKKRLDQQLATLPRYLTVVEKSPPRDIPVHIRGDVHNLGQVVPRGFLTALPVPDASPIAATSSGRLELAQWLSSGQNPLTARVYANRVWCWLMGQGLVPSVNNFGTTGVPPTHPELLDWLASELIRSGWSTKHLVRTIVLSDAYRRALIEPNPQQSQIDPANQLYWRGHSRRLTAEALRDAMLSISGELDEHMGGSMIRAGTKDDYSYQHQSTRRSIYHPVFRNSLPELYEAFDFADTSVSTGQRPRSTVSTQALVLLNHPWVAARAQAAAQRVLAETPQLDDTARVQQLYQRCFFRSPTPAELTTCLQFLQTDEDSSQADKWSLLIHSLFAALDFRYLE